MLAKMQQAITKLRRNGLIATTATAFRYACAARAFTDLKDMLTMFVGNGVAREIHDGVSERFAFIGLDPRL